MLAGSHIFWGEGVYNKCFSNNHLSDFSSSMNSSEMCTHNVDEKQYEIRKQKVRKYNSRQKCLIFFMYSHGQKKRDTRCYSDTYHRREMKLVPFFIAKCPL